MVAWLIWAIPGDPASIICPPEVCAGTTGLAERWNLDRGPIHFYLTWVSQALNGDLGNSWRVQQGVPVVSLMKLALPNTLSLILLASLPLMLGAVVAALGRIPRKLEQVLQLGGALPAVVLALVAAAVVQLHFGADMYSSQACTIRLLAGALVLGIADGALSSAVTGSRTLFQRERGQRYVQVARLRGENVLSNTLPNVAGAWAGQLRARILHLMSGAVIVEAVLRIDGLGDLLWRATLLQDFGIVLAAATFFALMSALLLLLQALVEVFVAWHSRRAPSLVSRQSTTRVAA